MIFVSTISALQMQFWNEWHCIGIKHTIDMNKPFSVNIGELPIVVWKNPDSNSFTSTLNICSHMGSKLDTATITHSGCLKCPYHGLEVSPEKDTFGKIMEHEGKLFWSFSPLHTTPYPVPFYNNDNYVKSFLTVDMDCSLTDSAYNTMDLRHPEFVHKNGFGNTIPPENIKHYFYSQNRIGLSFDYSSNPMIRKINNNVKYTKNFHMYVYPSFSWSKVSFLDKHLIIGVNLLPLSNKKTRWFITICHNYYKTEIGKKFMKSLALIILSQDFKQMKNQFPENDLKKEVLFDKTFKDEEAILHLREMLKEYKYPDIEECIQLVRENKTRKNTPP
jgi:nitrite reductase/ring-hydroxylating ferredoxin subunit